MNENSELEERVEDEDDSVEPGFLREADMEQVGAHLARAGDSLDLDAARALLRNPYLTEELVSRLVEIRSLQSSYRWRLELAKHRLVPLARALALVQGLFWRDLAVVGLDVSIRPQVRRQAEQTLLQRLPKLALGERIALARIASRAIVAELRKESNERVFRSLLENPRLTEGDLMPLVVGSFGHPSTLAILARDRRWGTRYAIRYALVRNPKTPIDVAIHLVASLNKTDLRVLAKDPSLKQPIKKRCKVLLGELV